MSYGSFLKGIFEKFQSMGHLLQKKLKIEGGQTGTLPAYSQGHALQRDGVSSAL